MHLIIVPAREQAVEVGAAVDAKQHRFAVDHEGRIPIPPRRLRDQRKPIGPVMAVAGEQQHAPAVAPND